METSDGTRPRYYAAYGSNLNLPQMTQRCPTAEVVGSDTLQDWRLRFRGTPGNAVATIERKEGHTVPVLIFRVQPKDEKSLDGYEGWPWLYRKEEIEVKVDGKPITAFTYIMNETNHPYNQPGPYYFGILLAGYLIVNFDVKILMDAVENNIPSGFYRER